MYLELYNGRNFPNEEIDDWGFEGPILGPLTSVQLTYLFHLKLHNEDENGRWTLFDLMGEEDMIKFKDKFYGDALVITEVPEKDKHRVISIEKLVK